jgi:sugar/nucleoside kinase (ribokinase family)
MRQWRPGFRPFSMAMSARAKRCSISAAERRTLSSRSRVWRTPLVSLRRARRWRLARDLPGLIGVTLGAEGFLWRDGDQERRVPAPRVVAIDTLAAGDVWHGAFTLALGEQCGVPDAARFANAAAALKCTRMGGRLGAPTRDEVDALLRPTQ